MSQSEFLLLAILDVILALIGIGIMAYFRECSNKPVKADVVKIEVNGLVVTRMREMMYNGYRPVYIGRNFVTMVGEIESSRPLHPRKMRLSGV